MRHNNNFNGWRAVANNKNGDEHLLYMGMSMEQVKKNYPGSFYELLEASEQTAIDSISLEKWQGSPDCGCWISMDTLKVPRIYKQLG